MMRLRKRCVLLLGVVPGLTGCLSHTRVVERVVQAPVVQNATLDQLVAKLNTQFTAIQTMNASVEISASTGGARTGEIKDSTSLTGYIFLRKPEDLRVLLQLPVIRSKALDMVSDGKTFKLYIPPKSKAVEGTNEVTEPSKNGLENLRPFVFFDSLLVRGLGADQVVSLTQGMRITQPVGKGQRPVEEPDYDLELLAQPRGQTAHTERVVHISRVNLQPFQQDIYDGAGQVVTRALYSDYQRFGKVEFPTKIQIERPLDEYTLRITMTKMVFNEPLESDQFELKIPDGVAIQHMK